MTLVGLVALGACTERTPASELVYDSGVYIADAEDLPDVPDGVTEVDGGVLPVPTWIDDIQPIVQASCVRCHGEVLSSAAPMSLVTYADVTIMYHSVRTNTDDFTYNFMATAVANPIAPMPIGAPPLTDPQIDLFARWAAAGAPEGRGTAEGDGGAEDADVGEALDGPELDGAPVDAEVDGGVAMDAEALDADPPDADPDSGVMPLDAAPDAAAPDAAAPDAAAPDAAAPDAAAPDAAAPDAAAPDAAAPPDAGVLDPLVGIGTVDLVQAGFSFTEGPLWMPQDVLLFSDIGFNRINRLTPPSAVTAFRDPSNAANGLALDPQGRLVSCEHDTHAITRSDAVGGPTTLLVDAYQGLALNSPNDVTVRADGILYFTDPPYGLGARVREVPFNGVYRVVLTGTVAAITAEWQGAVDTRPNGVVLSDDEATLFMSDTAFNTITRFAINPITGALGPPLPFVTTAAGPDGMAIDTLGNIFVATSIGVEAYSPAGVRWGLITLPRVPSNIAWGDADRRTLYITANDALYRVRLFNPGVRD